MEDNSHWSKIDDEYLARQRLKNEKDMISRICELERRIENLTNEIFYQKEDFDRKQAILQDDLECMTNSWKMQQTNTLRFLDDMTEARDVAENLHRLAIEDGNAPASLPWKK